MRAVSSREWFRSDGGRPSPAAMVVLTAGYLALAIGVLLARADPATGYEPSIYTATPIGYWLCALGAVSVGLLGTLFWGRLGRYAGIGLAGLTVVTFVGLPFIRGYYFYGAGDALTHLGYARGMSTSSSEFFDLIYPGGHTFSVFLGQAMGVPLRHGLMYAMLTVAVVTLLFLPLCVWVVTREVRAVCIAAFTAMLLLPVNNISTTISFHSYTLAVLFFPFPLYLMFKHVTRSAEDATLPHWLSATSLLAPVPLFAIVLYHPQVAIDVVILYFTIVLVGVVARRRARGEASRIASPVTDGGPRQHRLLIGQATILAVLFVVWALQHEQTYIFAENFADSIAQLFQTGEGAGAVAEDRSQSADKADINLIELFIKLFTVSLLYILLSAGLILGKLSGRVSSLRSDAETTVTYITVSALTLGPFFLAQFVGDISGYFFRHLGFAMVLAGILGSIALYSLWERTGPINPQVKSVLAVAAVVVLCLSLVSFYHSPYIYLPSKQTTEQEFAGFESSARYLPEEAAIAKIRPGTGRMEDATGATLTDDQSWFLTGPDLDSKENTTQFRGADDYDYPGYYIIVSESDRKRETAGFPGLRFQSEDFTRIREGTDPRFELVLSNGDYQLYYVDQEGLPVTPSDGETASLPAPRDGE